MRRSSRDQGWGCVDQICGNFPLQDGLKSVAGSHADITARWATCSISQAQLSRILGVLRGAGSVV